MFDFFKNIRSELADFKARLVELETKVEGFFNKAPEAAEAELNPGVKPVEDEAAK